jgi:hypothetical protein
MCQFEKRSVCTSSLVTDQSHYKTQAKQHIRETAQIGHYAALL